ncbi:MAG: DUF928 domain-containing protein [Cyanobacteria bacterium P01_F01_bin.150]
MLIKHMGIRRVLIKPLSILTLSGLWGIVSSSFGGLVLPAWSTEPPLATPNPSKQFVPPPPPTTLGTPQGRSRGGGSRGDCLWPEDSPPLTALVPTNKNELAGLESVWSYTMSDRPTFWFYLPYELEATTDVLFILQDGDGNTLEAYSQMFRPSLSPGIVSITLPDIAPPLDVGKGYHWFFQVYCDENPDFVDGWVYRTAPETELDQQLQAAVPKDQSAIYANNGIWQEAIASLARLRQADPEDGAIASDWRQLLESVGLEAIADQPFTTCCEPPLSSPSFVN